MHRDKLREIVWREIVIRPEAYLASRGSRRLQLSITELSLLTYLVENPDRVHSREELLAAIGSKDGEATLRSIDVWIGRVRKALCQNGEPDVIRTVRCVGYALQHGAPARTRSAGANRDLTNGREV